MSEEQWAKTRIKQLFGYLRADVEALAIEKTLSLLRRHPETDFNDAMISDLVTSARLVIVQRNERTREIADRQALIEEESFERESSQVGYWRYPRLSPVVREPSWVLPAAATVAAETEGSEQMLECRMCHKPLGQARKGKQFCSKQHQKRYWYLHKERQR